MKFARKCVLTNHIDWKTFESCFISSFEIKNILFIFFKENLYEKSKNCQNLSKSLNIELKLGMDVCFDRIQLRIKNDVIEACRFFSKNIFRNFPMGIHAKIQKNGHISKTKRIDNFEILPRAAL